MHKREALYHRLKIRIAVSCIVLTGFVLLLACLTAYNASVRQLRAADEQVLSSQCDTVEAYLLDTNIRTENLLNYANENHLIIIVMDCGQQLTFSPAATTAEVDALLAAVADSGYAELLNSVQKVPKSTMFQIKTEGQDYRAALRNSYHSLTQWHNTLVLQRVAANSQAYRSLGLTYLGVFLGGMALLALISVLLAHHAARPVEQAHAQQFRFLASASHELKSPLAVVSSSVDVLQRGLGNEEEQYKNIQTEIKQMAHLIDDMLVLTNGGTGRWALQCKPLAPEDIVLATYEMYLAVMEKKRQTLLLELPDEAVPTILADEERLRQILCIFLDNASSYSPVGSTVTLRLEKSKTQIRFVVIDHGPGIAEAEKREIFSYFYRKPTHECSQGQAVTAQHFGLGLAVANELAQLHHGKIELTDTPGGGATFALVMESSKDKA